MKKIILPCMFIVSSVTLMNASPLTPEQALTRAFDTSGSRVVGADRVADYHLEWSGVRSGAYIFKHHDGGFMLVSGDSEFPAILGYSDDSEFDADSMPPALSEYLTAVDQIISSGQTAAFSYSTAGYDNIEPMVTAKWDQGAPFNDLCPELYGEKALTGCVATAMAQVMHYWKSPAEPIGKVEYEWAGGGKTLSYDFNGISYDWENMLDVYDDGATPIQKNAVAELMLGCGMASLMNYSLTFSGTTDMEAGLALIEHFGYRKGLRALYRDFYRTEEWNSMLYEELRAGRPMLYYGFTPSGGHAFVCDGYHGAGGDYFHINWGWGGVADGYFLITALNPDTVGSGGSAGGYNIMQSAIFGLQPSDGIDEDFYHQMLCFGFFSTGATEYKIGDSILFGVSGGLLRAGLFNMSLETLEVTPGIKLVSDDGSASYIGGKSTMSFPSGAGVGAFYLNSSFLPKSGTYRVYPAYKISGGVWRDMPEECGMKSKITASISNNKITFNVVNDSEEVIVTDFNIDNTVYDVSQPVNIEISYTSRDLTETVVITPALADSRGQIVATGTPVHIEAVAGQSGTADWECRFSPAPEPGKYQLGLIDSKTVLVIDAKNITFVNKNIENVFELSDMRFNRMLAKPEGNVINGTDLTAAFRLILKEGYFEGEVSAMIYDKNQVAVRVFGNDADLSMLPGDYKAFTFKGTIADLNPDETYGIGVLCKDNEQNETRIGDIYYFSAPDGASVSEISITDDEVSYFNLQGIPVSQPVRGQVMIEIRNGKASKVR